MHQALDKDTKILLNPECLYVMHQALDKDTKI